jgi:hypothetical protein
MTGNSNGNTNGHAVDHIHSHTNGDANGHTNGNYTNGHTNGHTNGQSNGHTPPVNDAHNHQNGSVPTDGIPNGTPIAICGMGMRLPGGIRNDTDLYNFLVNKGDARSVIGEDRFNVDAYYSPHGNHGTINTKHGYFINDVDLTKVDLSMFSLTPGEAEQLDPNHRLVLEVVREAFESSGESDWRGKNIGTYVGLFSEDWQELSHKDTQEYNTYRVLGGIDFALPNRIAYEYDLKGPRYVLFSCICQTRW